MANHKFMIGKIWEAGVTTEVYYYIADTDAGKPVTGLNVGDLCWAVNTGILWVATSATGWSSVLSLEYAQALDYDWTGAHIFRQPIDLGDGFLLGTGGGAVATSTYLPITGLNSRLVVVGGSFASSPPASTEIGYVNATAKTTAIASANLTNTTAAGLYRVSYFLRCTTADVTAGTISFSTTYTDNVGATTETSAVVALTATVNRTQGSFVVYLASGNITYLTTLTGIAGTSQYQLRARCEYLG